MSKRLITQLHTVSSNVHPRATWLETSEDHVAIQARARLCDQRISYTPPTNRPVVVRPLRGLNIAGYAFAIVVIFALVTTTVPTVRQAVLGHPFVQKVRNLPQYLPATQKKTDTSNAASQAIEMPHDQDSTEDTAPELEVQKQIPGQQASVGSLIEALPQRTNATTSTTPNLNTLPNAANASSSNQNNTSKGLRIGQTYEYPPDADPAADKRQTPTNDVKKPTR